MTTPGNHSILANYSPPNSLLVDFGTIDPEALAFRAVLPAKYQAILSNHRAHREALAGDGQREDRERKAEGFISEVLSAAERQREIDSNPVSLSINGEDFEIEQGDLRKIMEKRLRELREQRDQMIRSGSGAAEIDAMDDLIERYETTTGKLGEGKADESTVRDVQDLMERDPELANLIKENRDTGIDESLSAGATRTSFAAEQFGEGMAAPPLRSAFADGGSAPSEAPGIESGNPSLDTTFEKFGL